MSKAETMTERLQGMAPPATTGGQVVPVADDHNLMDGPPAVEPDPRDPELVARIEARHQEAANPAPPEAVQEEEAEIVAGVVHPDPEVAHLGAKQITDEIIAAAWGRYIDNINYEVNQAKANGKAGPWYLRNYVPAHVRVLCFRRDHPNGALITDIEETKRGWLATARVYAEAGDHKEERYCDSARIASEGEVRNEERFNFHHTGKFLAMGRKTSREIENAETGAISRALGFMGYGAVASIAIGEEVEEARDNKRERQTENARHARELAERNRQAAEKKRAEKPAEEPVRATVDDATQRAREKLIEFIGGKRILSREQVEQVFGLIEDMDRERVKEVGGKLVKIKTSAAWQKLCAKFQYASRWKDFEGGTDLEQLRAYLFALVSVSTGDDRDNAQAALDAAAKLVPFDDVEEEGAKIVATLAEKVNLTEIEEAAEERRKADQG